jgi:type IV secretion system protein VirD4
MLAYLVILALVILADSIGRWAFLPARYLPRTRARALQARLHLRLHPGKGFATIFGLWLRWGRLAALRRSARIRRSLPWHLRALFPGEHSVFLGRAHWRHGLRVPLEEHVLVMAPPRTFKTAFLADVILRYPGPVIATTTKADVFALTAGVRRRRGRVHVFNPQLIGGVASTFSWSPVEGCEDPATAIRRADAFAFAVSREGVEDGTFWSAKASDYLRGYFHAAALGGYDMQAVAAWVSGADPHIPEQVLAGAGAHQWALTLAELRSEAQKTTATVRMVMSRALSFMADPALAASVLPRYGEGFDIASFLYGCGTVYLIAEATGEDAPVAPLFAAMASEIHYVAALTGQASPSGRLDPPLLMGLDEVTQICPVPLPSWLSDSGGKGIQVVAVAHGEAQLSGRWADHGRQVVMDTSSVKVFLPGITDTGTLEMASTLCGQAEWKTRGDDRATHHAVATPDMIRQLPTGFALVIRGGNAPVIARLPRAWNRLAYRRAHRHRGFPLPAAPRPGLEAWAEHEAGAWTEHEPEAWPGNESETWPGHEPEQGTHPEAEQGTHAKDLPSGWSSGAGQPFPWSRS